MSSDPVWPTEELTLAVHARQIAEHGGSDGIRDNSLLQSALARPQQLYAHGKSPLDTAVLAASLTYGIAKNHPFVDGKKRTAAVLCELFIIVNGARLCATDQELLEVILALAEGTLSEEELAEWIRHHLKPVDTESIHEPASKYSTV
jgi:death on curing protein